MQKFVVSLHCKSFLLSCAIVCCRPSLQKFFGWKSSTPAIQTLRNNRKKHIKSQCGTCRESQNRSGFWMQVRHNTLMRRQSSVNHDLSPKCVDLFVHWWTVTTQLGRDSSSSSDVVCWDYALMNHSVFIVYWLCHIAREKRMWKLICHTQFFSCGRISIPSGMQKSLYLWHGHAVQSFSLSVLC